MVKILICGLVLVFGSFYMNIARAIDDDFDKDEASILDIYPAKCDEGLLYKAIEINQKIKKDRLVILRFRKEIMPHKMFKGNKEYNVVPRETSYEEVNKYLEIVKKDYAESFLLINEMDKKLGSGFPLYNKGGLTFFLVRLDLEINIGRLVRFMHLTTHNSHQYFLEEESIDRNTTQDCNIFDCEKPKKLRAQHKEMWELDTSLEKDLALNFEERFQNTMIPEMSKRGLRLVGYINSYPYLTKVFGNLNQEYAKYLTDKSLLKVIER